MRDLNERECLLLREILRRFVEHGEPVSSRALHARFPQWSPSTIRLSLQRLEEAGYLRKPHPYSGRVPTEKGFRWYAAQAETLTQTAARLLPRVPGTRDPRQAITEVVQALAGKVQSLAFAVVPLPEEDPVERFQVEGWEGAVLMAMLFVSRWYAVRLLQEAYLQRDMPWELVTRQLTAVYRGRTLPEVQREEVERALKGIPERRRLLELVLEFVRQQGIRDRVLLEDAPAGPQPPSYLEWKGILVEGRSVRTLVARVQRSPAVIWARELGKERLSGVFVLAEYRGARLRGLLGAVHEEKTDFEKVIGLVTHFSGLLSHRLQM